MVVLQARGTGAAPTTGTTPVAQAVSVNCGGKTPKGCVVILTRTTTLGTKVSGAAVSIGFADGTVQRCAGSMDENGVAISSTDSGWRSDTAAVGQFPLTTSEAVDGKVRVASFAADTVNLEWDDLPGTAIQVEVIAVYGDDAACEVVGWTSAGSVNGTTSVSCSFSFGFLYVASLYNVGLGAPDESGANSRLALGLVTHLDGVVRMVSSTHYSPDRPSTSIRTGQSIRDDGFHHRFTIAGATGTVTEGTVLTIEQVTSSGFVVRTNTIANTEVCVGLAIKTNRQRVWAGIPAAVVPPGGGAPSTLKTATSGRHTVQDPGFRGRDVVVIATDTGTKNATVSGGLAIKWALGYSDGTNHLCAAYSVQPVTSGNSVSDCLATTSSTVRVLAFGGATNTLVASVEYTGTGPGNQDLGFEFNITTASGGDRQVAFAVLSQETIEVPSAVALPLVLPAPTVLRTETPSAVTLPLVLPAPSRLLTEKPAAAAIALAVPAPTRLLTETPSPVPVALALPAPARLLTETPAAVALALVLPAPTLLLERRETPTAVPLALALPAPSRLLTEKPAAVALPLVVPAPMVLEAGRESPLAVPLALVLPAPSRLLTEKPAAAALALALPAPARVVVSTPSAVALPLVVPAVLRLQEVRLTPAPVPLQLVSAVPRVVLTRAVLLLLELELPRALSLELEAPRDVELELELPRRLELPLGLV